MRRLAVLGAVAIGALAMSGCTLVPTASSPERIARHEIPFGLLSKTIPGTNHGRVRFITQPVYIVDATGHLAPSSRIVPSPPVLATVLRQLIVGPTQIESFAGYSSALPTNLVLLSASIKNGLGYIDLATPLSRLSRTRRRGRRGDRDHGRGRTAAVAAAQRHDGVDNLSGRLLEPAQPLATGSWRRAGAALQRCSRS
jgi:hypothetical protein